MSYDIHLLDPVTKEPIQLDSPHQMKGGTFALGGTTEAHINITYNYWGILSKVLDSEKGIRSIYGKSASETIPLLKKAITQLQDDVDDDYWKPTEGNVKQALYQLLALANLRPDGIWDGD